MYRYLDELLAKAEKKMRVEFNRFGVMGFDELNVVNTGKRTTEMFTRLLKYNDTVYQKAAKDAYKKAKDTAEKEGYSGKEDPPGDSFVAGILAAYNLVTGYLYKREAERKRLRLNEQILTAREYDDRQMYNTSLRRTANLWWTQTAQYGISVVDSATIKGYKDMGVEDVVWIAADDEKTCSVCGERDGEIYDISKIPAKPHYGCRCRLVPVTAKERK